MADQDTRKLIVTQPKDTAFAVSGSDCDDPLSHNLGGEVTHRTDKPLVHMHLWNEECVGKLDGKVEVSGNAEAPVALQHRFPDEHNQTHEMKTALDAPVHHALQMRTPLQVRFCNSWHVASDYTIGVTAGDRQLFGIRLTGATVATPQPCPEEECAPTHTKPTHP